MANSPAIRVGPGIAGASGRIPQLRIAFDEARLRKAQQELAAIPNGLPRAISGAINKVLNKGRTVVVNELYALLTAKRGNILGRVTRSGASPTRLRGSINIQQRRIGAVNFKFKEKRKKRGWGTKASGTGVEVQFYKGGQTQRFPHAFVAVGKSGNKHIFEREGRFGARAPRFPLIRINGLSLMTEFENRPDMRGRVLARISADMDTELDSQVNRLLARKKPE